MKKDSHGQCKHCFWNIPVKRTAILSVRAVVVMMARELEELLALSLRKSI